jgi:hypothetical protein
MLTLAYIKLCYMATMANYLVFSFNDDQRRMVHSEARRRQEQNEKQGLKGRNNAPASGAVALRLHTLGAAGEMAVASYLGLAGHVFQETTARRGSCDLPHNIDVKTRSRHYYDLVVQLDEEPNKILVLVTIENKETRLHGWIRSQDAMQEKRRNECVKNRPAYFVPKSALHPLSLLQQCLSAQTSPSTLLA